MSKYKLYADIDCLCLHLHLAAWEFLREVFIERYRTLHRHRAFQRINAVCALCVLGFGFHSSTSPGMYMTVLLGGLC